MSSALNPSVETALLTCDEERVVAESQGTTEAACYFVGLDRYVRAVCPALLVGSQRGRDPSLQSWLNYQCKAMDCA
jgi:hypothetical protein